MKRITRWLIKTLLLGALLVATLLLGWAFQSRSLPSLQSWHTETLASEFQAADADSQTTLADYLAREDNVFAELQKQVYDGTESSATTIFSRYRSGGPQDPAAVARNWNRSFELIPDNPRGGALLLHGLTDSPYSLRSIAQMLYAKGYYVLGLRMPGHGTIPGALTQVHWEDWVAASRIGARHVRARIGPEQPFVMAGYSNGGGLSVKYALDALADSSLPRPDQLLLFSPEIGIAPIAVISNSHKLLSFLPYFEKFKWLSVQPEYDPFKYNSFPKNAAQEAWEVTRAINVEIDARYKAGLLEEFPPVLTFLSWSDSTVKTEETIRRLYDRLDDAGNELVVFDVNRYSELAGFLPSAQETALDELLARSDLPYRLTVIGNVSDASEQLTERTKAPRTAVTDINDLGVAWPQHVYSLAHVSIPFPPDDPVYGTRGARPDVYQGLPLGALQPRGETNLLAAPMHQLMRLRHNPFFSYMEERILETLNE